jgi:hypothetical protein
VASLPQLLSHLATTPQDVIEGISEAFIGEPAPSVTERTVQVGIAGGSSAAEPDSDPGTPESGDPSVTVSGASSDGAGGVDATATAAGRLGTQCADGRDNDGDGASDAQDLSCLGPFDDSEATTESESAGSTTGDPGTPRPAPPASLGPIAAPTAAPTVLATTAPTPAAPTPVVPTPVPSPPQTAEPTPVPATPSPTPVPATPSPTPVLPTPSPTPTVAPTPEPPVVPACTDGVDNDGDLLIDWPLDLGCASPDDTDESGLIL